MNRSKIIKMMEENIAQSKAYKTQTGLDSEGKRTWMDQTSMADFCVFYRKDIEEMIEVLKQESK